MSYPQSTLNSTLNSTLPSKAQKSTTKELTSTTLGLKTSDGDGVNLTRLIGTSTLSLLDPFLMLDAFGTDKPQDYIGGFPSHPHRGFETVTYLLAGRMRHKDNAGNEGVIEPGGIQWMSAGKGIVHSEMPEQKDGLLMGFQLWVNLPAKAKMTNPKYQEFDPSDIPIEHRQNGTTIRVISGETSNGTIGPVKNEYVYPTYMDITLPTGQSFAQTLHIDDNTFIYVIEGSLKIGEDATVLDERFLGVLGSGDKVIVKSHTELTRFLLVSAQPLNEPIARGGPFVMNTQEEITQAFDDFRNNRL